MREIKLRAWDNVNKKYVKDLDRWCVTLSGNLIMAESSPPVVIRKNEYELEQYTGLKDKNGVDIYEGDIVMWGHVDGFNEHTPRIAIVKLEPSLNFDTVNLGKYNHAFHYGNFAYARSIDKCMEVIGNIHQNPELLN